MKHLKRIKEDFKRIKKLGFVECKRPNNKDGGVGNTYEDLLGVKENNLKRADYLGFEIKSKKDYTKSYISMFSKSPSYPLRANTYLRETYGEIRDLTFPNNKKLYASLFGNRLSIVYNKYKMGLKVNKKKQIVELVIYDFNDNLIDNQVYWTFDDLRKATKKLTSLLLVVAETKVKNGVKSYHYNEAEIYSSFSFENFISNIENGSIQFDIRIGVYNSGKSIGKTHDHGSGFRIQKENFKNLYIDFETLT